MKKLLLLTTILAFLLFSCGPAEDDGPVGTPVTFNSVVANGSPNVQSTTELILTFSEAITGLSAGDITLSGVPDVNKRSFTSSGPTYTLRIDGFKNSGVLSVKVAKENYDISGSTKTVNIIHYEPIDDPSILTKNFWAQDLRNSSFYSLKAGLLAEGTYCKIWVEEGSGVSIADAKKVAEKYDIKIYPNMIEIFGIEEDLEEDGEIVAHNTMEYADWLGDGDGKLTILLLDIKDGFNGGAYTAGYFWQGNFFGEDSLPPNFKTNLCDMIYVDTYPGLELAAEGTYATLAHEMQHMMSFVTGLLTREEDLNTWIDEGLSSAAEWVYFEGDHEATGRVNLYNANHSGLINKGNNFFVWDNHDDIPNAILDDYSTVYLFFQWLRLQTGGTDIYWYIITSNDFDYNVVLNAYAESNTDLTTWDEMLEAWLAANRINAASGLYGYKNEPELKAIKSPDAPAGTTSIDLYPGEGVYSKTNSNPSVTSTTNIKYSFLSATAPNNTYTATTLSLLTYNGNTDIEAQTEEGTTTGVASVNVVPDGRSIRSSSGPIRLDARDMARRNGNTRNTSGYSRSSLANRMRLNANR